MSWTVRREVQLWLFKCIIGKNIILYIVIKKLLNLSNFKFKKNIFINKVYFFINFNIFIKIIYIIIINIILLIIFNKKNKI